MQSTPHHFRSMHASGRRSNPPTLSQAARSRSPGTIRTLGFKTSAITSATNHEQQHRSPKARPPSFSNG
eukprot:1371385-Amphidinium_carterae.1